MIPSLSSSLQYYLQKYRELLDIARLCRALAVPGELAEQFIAADESCIIPSVDISEAYDPIQDKWITTLESMPSKRSGIAAASVNNSIFVFGGEEPFKTFDNNEKYDVKTKKWTIEPPMPTARHGFGAISVDNDRIYVIAGGPEPGLSVSDANEIYHVK